MGRLFEPMAMRRPLSLSGVAAVAALCLLVAALSGCATSADPHDGGFVDGVVGLAGGGYQERIDEREAVYGRELDARERLRREAAAIEAERAAVRGELRQAEARLASLESQLARQRAALRAQQGSSAAARSRLRQVEQAQARASGARGAISEARSGDAPVGELKAQSRQIRTSIDEIDAMVESVAAGAL